MSFWLNYTTNAKIIETSEFNVSVDSTTENITLQGVDDSFNPFVIEANLQPNIWNNIIITSNDDTFELIIDSQRKSSQLLSVNVSQINTIQLGNAQFDEITIINRSIDDDEIAQLTQARESVFVEYQDSLNDKAIGVDNINSIDLSLENQLNQSFSEFALEIWVQLNTSSGGEILMLENTSSTHNFVAELYQDSLNISIDNGTLTNFDYSTPNLMDGRYKHILVQLTNAGDLELYVNNNLVNSYSFGGTLGNYDRSILFGGGGEFRGILDEFVLYNTSFSNEELDEHYYNFESSVGGCCNYFKMYNEDRHATAIPNNLNVSTSTIFLHNWSAYDIFVGELERKNSSYPSTYDWYGTLVDACQPFVYNLDGYSSRASFRGNASFNTCVKLIEKGIY
jgi:hypothetical protein